MATRSKGSESLISLPYFAGFFDGEGSIFIAKINNKKSGNVWYRLNLSCCNSVKSIMEEMHNRFSPSRKTLLYRPRKKISYKPSYQWLATGNVALQFLETLLPFLIVKKEQAKVAIEFQKWRSSLPNLGRKRDKEILDKFEKYRLKLKILNGTASCND